MIRDTVLEKFTACEVVFRAGKNAALVTGAHSILTTSTVDPKHAPPNPKHVQTKTRPSTLQVHYKLLYSGCPTFSNYHNSLYIRFEDYKTS